MTFHIKLMTVCISFVALMITYPVAGQCFTSNGQTHCVPQSTTTTIVFGNQMQEIHPDELQAMIRQEALLPQGSDRPCIACLAKLIDLAGSTGVVPLNQAQNRFQMEAQSEADLMASNNLRRHVGQTIADFEGMGWTDDPNGTPPTCTPPNTGQWRLVADATSRNANGAFRVRAWERVGNHRRQMLPNFRRPAVPVLSDRPTDRRFGWRLRQLRNRR